MPRQIPAGLNWFEAPESAAVRAHNENVFATSLVRNASAGLLYRDTLNQGVHPALGAAVDRVLGQPVKAGL